MHYLNSKLWLTSFKIRKLLPTKHGFCQNQHVFENISVSARRATTQEMLVFSAHLLGKQSFVEFLHAKYSNLKYHNLWIL